MRPDARDACCALAYSDSRMGAGTSEPACPFSRRKPTRAKISGTVEPSAWHKYTSNEAQRSRSR